MLTTILVAVMVWAAPAAVAVAVAITLCEAVKVIVLRNDTEDDE